MDNEELTDHEFPGASLSTGLGSTRPSSPQQKDSHHMMKMEDSSGRPGSASKPSKADVLRPQETAIQAHIELSSRLPKIIKAEEPGNPAETSALPHKDPKVGHGSSANSELLGASSAASSQKQRFHSAASSKGIYTGCPGLNPPTSHQSQDVWYNGCGNLPYTSPQPANQRYHSYKGYPACNQQSYLMWPDLQYHNLCQAEYRRYQHAPDMAAYWDYRVNHLTASAVHPFQGGHDWQYHPKVQRYTHSTNDAFGLWNKAPYQYACPPIHTSMAGSNYNHWTDSGEAWRWGTQPVYHGGMCYYPPHCFPSNGCTSQPSHEVCPRRPSLCKYKVA